ncbi:hypothetical protein C7T94_06115 [Pedobacter yulinensis]|uniref:Uncharacterized protein n=1 Tax=Pedobacter yulinensis TaxID=2126353 RepID=A0A2T3HPH7_9SPHI|nr:hypothetical protein [Pedobacter yulinensis]PST84291.1 hypothetical protein C7T94_06115 [Pedobacter yulinensis]
MEKTLIAEMKTSTTNGRHKRVLLQWLAIYPVITLILLLLDEHLRPFTLPVRTLILTVLVVPIMGYVVMPVYAKFSVPGSTNW